MAPAAHGTVPYATLSSGFCYTRTPPPRCSCTAPRQPRRARNTACGERLFHHSVGIFRNVHAHARTALGKQLGNYAPRSAGFTWKTRYPLNFEIKNLSTPLVRPAVKKLGIALALNSGQPESGPLQQLLDACLGHVDVLLEARLRLRLPRLLAGRLILAVGTWASGHKLLPIRSFE